MKRFILIFLMLLLPLQFSFAAAARYCADEVVNAPEHFGHHAHGAGTDVQKIEKQSFPDASEKSGDGVHCHYCHSVCANIPVDVCRLGTMTFGLPPKVALQLLTAQHQPLPPQRPPIASLA